MEHCFTRKAWLANVKSGNGSKPTGKYLGKLNRRPIDPKTGIMKSKGRSTVEERRPAVRVAVDLEAKYQRVGIPPQFEARITDISTSGLRVRTSQRLAVGISIDIAFDLDDPSRRSRMTLRVRAGVVRVVIDEVPPFEYALMIVNDDVVKNVLRQAVLMINLSTPPEARR
jgi:PilZ domain